MPRQSSRLAVAIATAACLAVALSGCTSLGAKFRARQAAGAARDNNRPVELVYNAGADAMDQHDWGDAVDFFQEVEQNYPTSEWSGRAVLMEAYAHYRNAQYDEAVSDAERYIRENQGSSSTAYAYYIRAVCYFDQIYDVGRDQGLTTQALNALTDITTRFPTTEYAQDAKVKIDMVNDQLAGKEMEVGRFYLRDGKPLAAEGRFNNVIKTYQTTSHTPEALYRLVEVDLTLGLMDDAKRNGAVLGYNYPGDEWYSDAYKLLTDNGLPPAVAPTNRAGQRNAIQRLLQHGQAIAPPGASAAASAGANPTPAAAPSKKKNLLQRLF